MANPHPELLEMILRECAAAEPHPWHPATFAQLTGLPRAALDAALDQLRLAELVRLTPWVQGQGQGYQLTPLGAEAMQSPRALARLRVGEMPQPRQQPAAPVERHALAGIRGEKVRSALLDDSRPIVTQFLLAANVFWFLVGGLWFTHLGGEFKDYLMANVGQRLSDTYHDIGSLGVVDVAVDHQWWRLVTYGFVHRGFMHLFMNMFALYFIGPLAERMWGRPAYMAIYFVSCIGGGEGAMALSPSHPVVGASGALCGILGSMLIWVLLNKAHLPGRLASNWQSNILADMVLIGIISFLGQVSWAGHLGGGVTGALIAIPLNLAHFGDGAKRWVGWVSAAMLTILGLGLLQWKLSAMPDGVMRHAHNGRAMRKEDGDGADRQAQQEAFATDPTNVLLLRSDEAALGALNTTLKILNSKMKQPEADDSNKLAGLYAKTRGKLDQSLAKLTAIGKTAIPEQSLAIKTAIPYLERASKLSGGMKDLLGTEGKWDQLQVRDLRRQCEDVTDLRQHFVNALDDLARAWQRG